MTEDRHLPTAERWQRREQKRQAAKRRIKKHGRSIISAIEPTVLKRVEKLRHFTGEERVLI